MKFPIDDKSASLSILLDEFISFDDVVDRLLGVRFDRLKISHVIKTSQLGAFFQFSKIILYL